MMMVVIENGCPKHVPVSRKTSRPVRSKVGVNAIALDDQRWCRVTVFRIDEAEILPLGKWAVELDSAAFAIDPEHTQ